MFRQMVTMQLLLIGIQIVAGVLIGLSVEDESTRGVLLIVVSAPFAVFNLWLLLQNWIVYIYDVGIWGERVRAVVALVFSVGALLLVFLGISDWRRKGDSVGQSGMPPPMTEQQMAAEKVILLAEDQVELQDGIPQHSNDESP